VDRVVPAQLHLLGEVARTVREVGVDTDERKLVVERLELVERLRVGSRRQPSTSSCRGQRRATLGVGEDARRR
jgi:hypothetical protein